MKPRFDKKHLKYLVGAILLVPFVIILGLYVSHVAKGNEVVAYFNDKKIIRGDLITDIDEYIDNILIEMIAIQSGVEINDQDIDKAFKEELVFYSHHENPLNEFERYLEKNNLTLEQFKHKTKYYLLKKHTLDKMTRTLTVPEKDLRDAYNNNKQKYISIEAKRIVIENKTLAETILQQIKNGENFSSLVHKYSIDDQNIIDADGYVGEIRHDNIAPLGFTDEIFELSKGVVSLYETGYGYVLLKVIERNVDFKDVIMDVQKDLQSERAKIAFEKLLNDLREKQNIIYMGV